MNTRLSMWLRTALIASLCASTTFRTDANTGINPQQISKAFHLPIKAPDGSVACFLTIHRIYIEPQQKRFIRFGGLNQLIIDGVQIEFQQTAPNSKHLEKALEYLTSINGKNSLIVRNISLSSQFPNRELLTSSEARPNRNGSWSLKDAVLRKTNGANVYANSAVLVVTTNSIQFMHGQTSELIQTATRLN